jgi:hypothetical protein
VCQGLYDWNHRSADNTMTNLLLLNPDDRRFESADIERIFQSNGGFRDVRLNEPGGAVIEADYVEPEDWTIVGLSGSRKSISLSGTTDAALRAALILQRNLGTPLRIIDSDYSFDLIFSDFANVEELQTAIDQARAS